MSPTASLPLVGPGSNWRVRNAPQVATASMPQQSPNNPTEPIGARLRVVSEAFGLARRVVRGELVLFPS